MSKRNLFIWQVVLFFAILLPAMCNGSVIDFIFGIAISEATENAIALLGGVVYGNAAVIAYQVYRDRREEYEYMRRNGWLCQ